MSLLRFPLSSLHSDSARVEYVWKQLIMPMRVLPRSGRTSDALAAANEEAV